MIFETLIVCFRWIDVQTEARRYLPAATRVRRRLAQVGGDPISWGADRYSFEFDPDDFRIVLTNVLGLISEAATHAVGVSGRGVERDEEGRIWGPGLVVAEALAGGAKGGEVLLDPTLPVIEEGALATLGAIPVRVGEGRLSAALLLPGTCPPDGFRVSVPPTSRRSAVSQPVPDGRDAITERFQTQQAPARSTFAEALRSKRPESLQSLLERVKEQDEDELVVLRREAMANLARGDYQQGIEGLRLAVVEARARDPGAQARALLSLAVAQALAGDKSEALLHALESLARAREQQDDRGEQAAVRLIAKLAASAGHLDVAERWSWTEAEPSAST